MKCFNFYCLPQRTLRLPLVGFGNLDHFLRKVGDYSRSNCRWKNFKNSSPTSSFPLLRTSPPFFAWKKEKTISQTSKGDTIEMKMKVVNNGYKLLNHNISFLHWLVKKIWQTIEMPISWFYSSNFEIDNTSARMSCTMID